ncbi:MAG: helix-turn-helix domain-containing protein [Bryobacteraceae bacterium]|jgi:predicted DNA-binding transcriptional regulator AlpA
MQQNETYLKTKQQTARFLGISPAGVDRLRNSGALPCVRVGGLVRFDPRHLAEFVEQRTTRRELPNSGGAAA